ncbi:MAG: flavodoxin-dependent (E)-4-hydroxy-3-methylbut-2-enyl-diphosphate synthase [Thermodesulfobacteriota bacterium]
MLNVERRKTRQIRVGSVLVGGGAPVSVQSMTNTDTRDTEATLDQIRRLCAAGCEIVRVAVPDEDAVQSFARIKAESPLPLIADIHFDWRLAVAAAKNGADCLRINPGNIGGEKKVAEVVKAAADAGISLRVGVNAGSLEKGLLKTYGGPTAEAMVTSALSHLEFIRSLGFSDVKVSLKASDVLRTIEAYRLFSEKSDTPLHVGITEAGGGLSGAAKSAVGIGVLLFSGIGDTIRVSLTGDPVNELRVAWQILRSLRLRQRGVEVISCPTCGRTEIGVEKLAESVEQALSHVVEPLTVAVMGCVVNGPGEAREADFGIAGGRGQGIVFARGKVMEKVPEDQLLDALLSHIRKHLAEPGGKGSL